MSAGRERWCRQCDRSMNSKYRSRAGWLCVNCLLAGFALKNYWATQQFERRLEAERVFQRQLRAAA